MDIDDIESVVSDEFTQVGAGATAMGVAAAVPTISTSSVMTAAGVLTGTKAGAILGGAAIVAGAAPLLVIGGGLALIGVGIGKALNN
jgi:hypothetical protein